MQTNEDINPKHSYGVKKPPMHLVPKTAIALASLAHLDGALKYGAWNWRAAEVSASIYVAALERHIARWFNGEEHDPDSGLPHLAHALACLNIIVDARACGKLVDDRPISLDVDTYLNDLTKLVAPLVAKHDTHPAPTHYTRDKAPGL